MERYEKYKDSGVEWIGVVPYSWDVKRLKYVVSINDEALPETTNDNYEMEYVDISNVKSGIGILAMETYSFNKAPSRARRIVRDGDIIVSTVRTYLKSISKIDNPPNNLIVSTGFAVVRPIQVKSSFVGFLFYSEFLIGEIISRSTGVSYPAINASEVGDIFIPIPRNAEQTAIANYLDRKTAEIDKLIAQKERLLSLYEEEKTAIINQAVTRGINPDVKLKDSGIDWLGEIPEHWEVMRLRFLSKIKTGEKDTENREDNGEYPFYVRSQTIERISSYSFDGEAVLTAGDGVGVGKVFHYVNGKFEYHQRVYKISDFESIQAKFLFYYMQLNFYKEVIRISAKSTVDSLRLPMLQNFPVCFPSTKKNKPPLSNT